MPFALTSPAFGSGETIPTLYTEDGDSTSPPLAWSDTPQGTQSFVLIVHDPDTPKGDLTHWVLFDIPSTATHLPAGTTGEGVPGTNSMETIGYTPPAPPPGDKPHRYIFTLYALSADYLALDDSATREAVENSFVNHLLGQAELIGMFSRPAA